MKSRFSLIKLLQKKYSSAPECSSSCSEAIQKLIEKSRQLQPSGLIEKTLKSREWATAPVVLASGKMASPSWKKRNENSNPIVQIKWMNSEFENRNINIIIEKEDNMYTLQVKNVLYAIITGIHYKETKIRVRNNNEILIKVGNGKFNATREKARFALIQSCTLTKSKTRINVKLEKMDENETISTMRGRLISENEFFSEFSESINKLKKFIK